MRFHCTWWYMYIQNRVQINEVPLYLMIYPKHKHCQNSYEIPRQPLYEKEKLMILEKYNHYSGLYSVVITIILQALWSSGNTNLTMKLWYACTMLIRLCQLQSPVHDMWFISNIQSPFFQSFTVRHFFRSICLIFSQREITTWKRGACHVCGSCLNCISTWWCKTDQPIQRQL